MAFDFSYMLNGGDPVSVALPVAANKTVVAGDVLEFSSGKVQPAAAASSSIAGVAQDGITTGGSPTSSDTVNVLMSPDAVFEADFNTGGSKTSFSESDRGTAFDLNNETEVNPDDTTGGMCVVLNFDNSANTVDVLVQNRTFAT